VDSSDMVTKGGRQLGDDQRQLFVLSAWQLAADCSASLAQQGLVRCGTTSIGGTSRGDGRMATWLAADHGG
jgi:hypothetical protein